MANATYTRTHTPPYWTVRNGVVGTARIGREGKECDFHAGAVQLSYGEVRVLRRGDDYFVVKDQQFLEIRPAKGVEKVWGSPDPKVLLCRVSEKKEVSVPAPKHLAQYSDWVVNEWVGEIMGGRVAYRDSSSLSSASYDQAIKDRQEKEAFERAIKEEIVRQGFFVFVGLSIEEIFEQVGKKPERKAFPGVTKRDWQVGDSRFFETRFVNLVLQAWGEFLGRYILASDCPEDIMWVKVRANQYAEEIKEFGQKLCRDFFWQKKILAKAG